MLCCDGTLCHVSCWRLVSILVWVGVLYCLSSVYCYCSVRYCSVTHPGFWSYTGLSGLHALLPEVGGYKQLTYSRVELLQLRSSILCNAKPAVNLPPEIRPRKRGRRGGARTRLRKRPFRPPLPSMVLANVRSLRNKIDLLHAKCQVERAFRDACIIALIETWLDEHVPDRAGYRSKFFDTGTNTGTFNSIPVHERYFFRYLFYNINSNKKEITLHITVKIFSFIFQLSILISWREPPKGN